MPHMRTYRVLLSKGGFLSSQWIFTNKTHQRRYLGDTDNELHVLYIYDVLIDIKRKKAFFVVCLAYLNMYNI